MQPHIGIVLGIRTIQLYLKYALYTVTRETNMITNANTAISKDTKTKNHFINLDSFILKPFSCWNCNGGS